MAYDPADLKLPGWLLSWLEKIIRIRLSVAPSWCMGLTRLGAVFLLLAAGVVGAAVYSGNNLLYLCGTMLIAFGMAAAGSAYLMLRYPPDLARIMPESIGAGAAFNLRQAMDWHPALGAMVDVTWEGEGVQACFDIRCTNENSLVIGQMPRLIRGMYAFNKQIFGTEAPIGLWRIERCRDESWLLAVLPEPIVWAGSGSAAGSGEQAKRGEGDVFSDLRAYVPGDMPTRIHWKKAIDGDWAVKRFTSSGSPLHDCLCVDLRAQPGLEFERLLGCVYSWMLNHPTLRLVLGQEIFELGEPAGWQAAIMALAAAQPEHAPPIESGGMLLSVINDEVRRAA
ncbi:MAG: DUF58 domain-containing protein [Mariprofundaceae bacterium]